jgi:hypothetical protein
MATTQEIPSKRPNEVRNGAISLVDCLEDAETIASVSSVTATPAGLTFSNIQSNSAVIEVKGESVAIGKAIQFRVAGGTSGVSYSGVATASTTATPSQTVEVTFTLAVD